MYNLINLLDLKTATAIAAVLTMVASFAPKSAHAALRKADQTTVINFGNLNFTLNTSDMDSNPDPNSGQYTTGIENLNITSPRGQNFTYQVSVSPVTLYASRVDPSQLQPNSDNKRLIPTPITGFNPDLNDLTNYATSSCNNNPCVNTNDYNNGVVVYEAAFDAVDNRGTSTSNKLAFFVPSLGNQSLDSQQLVNSLSGLDGFNNIQGVFSTTDDDIPARYFGFNPGFTINEPYLSLEPVEAVPEPADTAGVLVLGAMGAISLLRRNRGIQ